MAINFTEFDTTNARLLGDLGDVLEDNTDWERVGYTGALATTSAASASNATTLTFASGTIPAWIAIGSRIRIDDYESGVAEFRDVTNKSATTLTIANLSNAHPAGTSIYWGEEVFKVTTVRGAEMYVDFAGGSYPNYSRLHIAAYLDWTPSTANSAGSTTQPVSTRVLYWRRLTSSANDVVHVSVSTSRDLLFLLVEGPRVSEVNPSNSSWGSPRNYFFASDLVPYAATDTTPVWVVGGNFNTWGASVANRDFVVTTSLGFNPSQKWVEGKVVSLQVPSMYDSNSIAIQRFTTTNPIDEYYLSPYVLVSDECGFRGRLGTLYFAGFNAADNTDTAMPVSNADVTYDGVSYRLLNVNRGDTTNSVTQWGPLGIVGNGGSSTFWRSPIVAVPVA